jgi:catechol 2,3-dioxygenase-like lactoylglutathione lyase family enzyme
MASINGIAHIQLSVSNMERSIPFYRKLLRSLDMAIVVDRSDFFYCVGGRTGVAIAAIDPEFKDQLYNQQRAGLHHFCFRARSREDVDEIHRTALELQAKIIRAPVESHWAPGYYSVLFEDPDGIRIEANYVPGKGHLESVDPVSGRTLTTIPVPPELER